MPISLPNRFLLSFAALVATGSVAASALDIPAGSLDQTLLSISQQSGKRISFDQSLVDGLNAPAIKGDLSAGEALQIALQGTDLRDSEGASGIVVSVAPPQPGTQSGVETPSVIPQLQRIEVTGSAIRRVDAETAVPVTILRTEELKNRASPAPNN